MARCSMVQKARRSTSAPVAVGQFMNSSPLFAMSPVVVGARRSGDPPALIADASRARHKHAWRPKYPDLSCQVMHAWSW
jgi:UDP-glucose 4-epimerase